MALIEGGVVTQINNLVNEIEFVYSTNHREVVPKLGGLRIKTKGNKLFILLDSDVHAEEGGPVIKVDYTKVTSPITASAVALRDVILGYVETESGDEEVMEMQVYIGKYPGHNGDFDVTRFDGDTLNIVTFPPRITEIFSDDIEFIRQIAQDGSVTAQYDRNDAAIRVNANRITVVGAHFLTTDRFVVWTNIYKATPSPDLEYSPGYIGKLTGENGDFDVSYNGATTLDIDSYPPGITEIFDADIEVIRQIDATGTVVTDYSRRNYTMTIVAGRITVTGATFANTDSFVVYTNLFKDNDIVTVGQYLPCWVGKPQTGNGDFIVDWVDADTLIFTTLPDGVDALYDDDIEMVRQINAAGQVVAIYKRDSNVFTMINRQLTVTGATFLVTDEFTVYTNIHKHVIVPDLELMPSYIGQPTGRNGDFDVAYTGFQTIAFTGLPSDVTTIFASNVEKIVVIGADGWPYKMLTPDRFRFTEVAGGMRVRGNDIYDVVFQPTDEISVYTNIPRPGGGGGASADADFKIASWDGTVTYASTTTVTLAGAYPTINYDSQIVYIKFVDATLNTAEVFINGQNGVAIEHAGGVLTINGAGTPFAATNVYEVGINALPIGADNDQNAIMTLEQAPDYGHYIDPVELVDGTVIGIYDWIWLDQGAEIDCRSYNMLTLWVILTAGDEAGNSLRVLSKHTSAGADEYIMETAGDYQKAMGTDNIKIRYDFELDHTTPFVQVQTRTEIQEAKTTSTTTTTTTPGFTRATISIKYTLGYK